MEDKNTVDYIILDINKRCGYEMNGCKIENNKFKNDSYKLQPHEMVIDKNVFKFKDNINKFSNDHKIIKKRRCY